MNYPYSINDLTSKCKVSKQSVYNLIRKNQDFINNNSTRKQRKIYYNQAVMDFFVSYYLPEETPSLNETPLGEVQEPQQEPPLNKTALGEVQETSLDALKAENDALKAEIDALRKQLDEKEAERREMFYQNSALLLIIQEEKKEKMLLLPAPPAPKKTFGERVKALFHKETKAENTETKVENTEAKAEDTK